MPYQRLGRTVPAYVHRQIRQFVIMYAEADGVDDVGMVEPA